MLFYRQHYDFVTHILFTNIFTLPFQHFEYEN